MVLQAIKYERGTLKLLDQRRLPLEETWIAVDSVQTAWSAIKDMVVRGAPAIAIAAALALATQLVASDAGAQFASAQAAAQHVKEELAYLVTRHVQQISPTAKVSGVASLYTVQGLFATLSRVHALSVAAAQPP